MRPVRIITLGCAGALLALFTLSGAVRPQCTPLPVEPDCVADEDCVEGAFCSDEGVCESFTACAADDECVKVSAGCCPCSMGGSSTAINAAWAAEWQAHLDCDPMIACPAVYLCNDSVPACVDGECALVFPPEDACQAMEADYPDSARACAYDAECAVVLHQYNCCGSMYAWGINADAVAAFDRAEALCQAQMPQCGCPTLPPVADDGNSGWDTDSFAATCVDGECFSFVVEP